LGEPAIEAIDLCKSYGDLRAVERASFRVERGEVVGFLGPNGAGKTTTLRLLAGFLAPTDGTARIAGSDVLRSPRAAKRHIGYLPERPPLYPEMTVRAFLAFVARVKGLSRARARDEVDRVMREADVAPVADRLIAGISRGFQQRVGIAQALLGEPPVLLLDEPTLGLDPLQMQFVRALIRRLARERTVLVSTHFLYEVEEVCSRALVIRDGKIVADAPLAELTASASGVRRVVVGVEAADAATLERARTLLAEMAPIVEADPARAGRFLVVCDADCPSPAEIARRLVEAGIPPCELTPLRPRLEEVFLELTGQPPEAGTGAPRAGR
jgi:ABC-2 type transport system ATP-binding protein